MQCLGVTIVLVSTVRADSRGCDVVGGLPTGRLSVRTLGQKHELPGVGSSTLVLRPSELGNAKTLAIRAWLPRVAETPFNLIIEARR